MDAPLTAIMPDDLDETPKQAPEETTELTVELTVSKAIAAWRERRGGTESPLWREPLLAAGELHGVMPPA